MNRKKPEKKCATCGRWFKKPEWTGWPQWENRTRFCSVPCRMEAAHEALRGKPSWNKGLKNKEWEGENNGNWRGDNAGYHAIHKWLQYHYKKKGVCELCDKTKKTVWANKSGEYKRLRDDWYELCFRCHFHFDRERKYKNKFEVELSRKYRNGKNKNNK